MSIYLIHNIKYIISKRGKKMNKNKQYIKDDYFTLILLVMIIGILCINFDFFNENYFHISQIQSYIKIKLTGYFLAVTSIYQFFKLTFEE